MTSLPYIASPGNIDKALKGIIEAPVPDKVSGDFVKTILKIGGGSGDQMTSYLKKLGMVNTDGSPNEVYKKFRNPTFSGQAIAQCIKHAYAPLYARREYMHKLDQAELIGLITEVTGLAHDSNPVKLTTRCINHLKAFADFEAKPSASSATQNLGALPSRSEPRPQPELKDAVRNVSMNLGYTINLNLPATSDPAVFDAIFTSLKEKLLSNDDEK